MDRLIVVRHLCKYGNHCYRNVLSYDENDKPHHSTYCFKMHNRTYKNECVIKNV